MAGKAVPEIYCWEIQFDDLTIYLASSARIPFGETKTYGEVAKMMGSPGGARAVGQAMGKNPLPLIFP